MFPKEKVTEDFDALADKLLRRPPRRPPRTAKSGFRLFGRAKEAVRA